MDFMTQMKALGLIGKLLLGQTENVSAIPYEPKKPPFPGITEGIWHFPRATPEAQGISSTYLERFYREMAADEDIDAHSILIVRNGFVIASGSFAPYRAELWHISHSMCKSVTGLAIGMLVAEGKLDLDEKLTDIFSARAPWFGPSLWHKSITVRHLLTMSSGVVFNEAGAITEQDWVRCYLESGREFEPGERFSYNSMNTMMLSAIVQEKSGQNLVDYLTPRLFVPLGIRNVSWEQSPTGVVTGGWGLRLCIEDMAKLGQLYLNGGIWEGKQIVPREWLEASSKKQIDSDPGMSPYGYGYQVWMGKMPGAYHFNGMLGQNVFIMPQYQLIVATTAGSAEIFGTGRLTELVYEYFQSPGFRPADGPLPEAPAAQRSLEQTLAALRFHTPCGNEWGRKSGGWYRRSAAGANSRRALQPVVRHGRQRRLLADVPGRREEVFAWLERLNGAVFAAEKNAAGILPFFIQLLHNNFTCGISEIRLAHGQGGLELVMREGEDVNRLRVGLAGVGEDLSQMGDAVENTVTVRGESYLTGVSGAVTRLESGAFELAIRICFLEESNTRLIRIQADEHALQAGFDEYPALTKMLAGLEPMINGGKEPSAPAKLFAELDFTKVRMSRMLAPQVVAHRAEES